jgi:hypothetical protein
MRKFKVKVVPETSHVLFAYTVAASPVPPRLPSSVPKAVPLFARLTSSQPPAISAQLVRNPEVKSSSFGFRNDQSFLNLTPSVQVIPECVPADVKLLLQKHCSILGTTDVMPKPTHGVKHHIHTGSHPPVFAKARRLDPQKLEIAKAEFKKLESAGIIRRSKSPWASPLHMVPKKAGSWPPRGDNPRLNMITAPDKYPLPNMQDLSNSLDGCSVFSKVDLVKGYHQIPVAPEDIPKTAIITPFSLFEYLFTPFGLSNAAQTFQRMIDRTCANLEGTFPYMDDPSGILGQENTPSPLGQTLFRLSHQWTCH